MTNIPEEPLAIDINGNNSNINNTNGNLESREVESREVESKQEISLPVMPEIKEVSVEVAGVTWTRDSSGNLDCTYNDEVRDRINDTRTCDERLWDKATEGIDLPDAYQSGHNRSSNRDNDHSIWNAFRD